MENKEPDLRLDLPLAVFADSRDKVTVAVNYKTGWRINIYDKEDYFRGNTEPRYSFRGAEYYLTELNVRLRLAEFKEKRD